MGAVQAGVRFVFFTAMAAMLLVGPFVLASVFGVMAS